MTRLASWKVLAVLLFVAISELSLAIPGARGAQEVTIKENGLQVATELPIASEAGSGQIEVCVVPVPGSPLTCGGTVMPSGKVLVIEHVSASLFTFFGELQIYTTAPSFPLPLVTGAHFLIPQAVPTAGETSLYVSQPVRLYVRPGESLFVKYVLFSSDTHGPLGFPVNLSGHFAPTP